jgi:histidinol-phosphate/aromatic aminotransferase/cobyric acid decarboxylase-like protein
MFSAAQPGAAVQAYSVGPAPPIWARRLHLNEYRYPHPPEVVDALRLGVAAAPVEDLLTNYQAGPDPALAEDLARYVGAEGARNVLITPGSDEALRAIIDTCGLRGHREVVMGVPGYTHFEHYARLSGLLVVTYAIGLATEAADHEASLRYHADRLARGCLVYLCNPNNPTGDLWAGDVVAALAAEYPKSLFLIDEAYVEFASVAAPNAAGLPDAAALNARSLVPVALAAENVVVTRTLSKAFGLAAMRIGYAVGLPKVIGELSVAVSPKAFGLTAALVARAALRHLGHYRHAALAARAEAAALVAALRAAGWWALDTAGNFFLVYVGDAATVTASLAARWIQVRDRDALPGLAGFVRITAGSAEDSAAILAAFGELTPPAEAPPQTLYTCKGHVAACKTLMKKTVQVLRAEGVEFFATAGTMLGMYRHGGMIPWDDDGDLAYVRDPARDQGLDLVAPFRAAGLTLQRNRTNAYWQVGTNEPGAVISPVHVDLFSFRAVHEPDGSLAYELDDERFRHEKPDSPQASCDTRYAAAELYPLRSDFRFYDEVIPMPAQTEAVLRRALGPDFMTTAKVRRGEGPYAAFSLRDLSPA